MAGQFDDVFGVKTEAAAPVAGGFDDIFAAGPKQNKGTAGDLVTSVKRGVLGLPGVVTGLADLAPAIGFGLRPFEKATNYIGEATGFQPSKWADKMQGEYSPSYLQAQENIRPALEQSKQELDAAQGFSETLGAGLRGMGAIGQKYIENPSAIGNVVADALPQVAAGGVISRGLMGVGKAASMGEPALAGAAGFLERNLGLETAAAVAGGAGEGLMQAGSSLNEATGTDQRKNAVAAISSGLLDAVIVAGAGKLVQSMGLDTLETAMAKGFNKSVTGELSGKAAALSKTGKILGGGASEGILQELPQSAQETVFQNYAEGKPLWENVPRSAVEGLLAGFVMGAGVNALPATTVKPDPKTDSGQSQLLSKLTGQDVTVTGGTATYTSPDGESFNVPVASLADHFATGGTLDTLDSATVTAPKLEALKGTLSYQEIADLRNSDELLREQGVSRRDVDNLLLSQVREVPGAEPLVRSMLETGTVDAQLIDRIKSGEFEPDPMGDEWARQTELARVNNIASLKRLNETEQRAAADAAVRDYENFDLTVPGQGQLPGDQGAAAEVAPQQTPQQTAIAEAVAQLNTPEDLNAYGNSVWEQVGQRQDLTDQQVSDLLKDVDEAVIRRIAELQTPQQTAAPAGTPPAGSPPPSLSDTSPTGAAPSKELKVVHYSRTPFKVGELPEERMGSESAFGDGLYGSEVGTNSEAEWAQMDRYTPGEYKNEITVRPKSPLVITPETVKSILPNLGDFRRDKVDAAIKQYAEAQGHDAIVVRGFFSEKIKQLEEAYWAADERISKSMNMPMTTPAERKTAQAAHQKLLDAWAKETYGVDRADTLYAMMNLQDQVYVDPKNSDILKTEQRAAQPLWRQAGLDTKAPIALDQVQAKKQTDGSYKLVYRGTENEIFTGQTFKSAPEARAVFKREQSLAQQTANAPDSLFAQAPAPPQFKTVDTEDPKFKEWFADSKVVDDAGKPQVVYHGTRTKGGSFESFELSKIGSKTDSGYMGEGFYFGDSRTASAYAGHYEFDPEHYPQGGAIYPAFISIKNPLVLKDRRENGRRVDLDVLAKEALGLGPEASSSELKEAAINKGYDGAIYQVSENGYREYVVFSPTQIKSAISNTGDFSATDSRIQFSEGQSQGAPQEQVTTALKSFIGERAVDNLIRKGKVEIVSDVSQVPNTAKLDARQRKSVLGAYNSGQGKVFLVAGNLDPARVPEIMRHEVVHALLREDSRFMLRREGILKSFNALAKNNASVQAALAEVPAGTAESIRLEEGLAYWVQQESNHKHSLFKRIISAVKSGLARLGIPVGKYSTTDLSRMFTGGMEAWVNQGQEQAPEVQTETQFSLDKPNTLFAMANTSLGNAEKSLTQKIKDFAQDKTLDNAPRWLSIAPLHTLVQTLGKKIPQIKQLSRHLEESEYISNDLINQAFDYYKNVGKLGPQVTEAINKVALTASFYRVNPMAPMLEQGWVPTDKKTKEDKLKGAQQKWVNSGMDKSTGKSYIAAYTEAKNAYAAINSKEGKDLYENMVGFMSSVREREKNNLLAYIEQSTVGNQPLREQLMQRFNATFKDISGAYWPLNRIGDYRMELTDIDGVQVVQHYESAAARRADKEMYIKNGVDPATVKESLKDRRPRGEVAIPMELMTQLSASVYNQKFSDVEDPNDKTAVDEARAAAQDVVDEMNQIWLRWQPETSALKNSMQRKNVKGADEDMMRSFLDYTRKHASNIAWAEQGRKIESTVKDLSDTIVAERKAGDDPTFKGYVLTEMRNRLQSIRDAKTGPIASTIGKLGTAWYMTSPSIALVQMTQLPILTFPKLAVKYKSISKAFAAMKNGTQAAFSKDFSKKKIFGDDAVNTLHEQLRETVTEEIRASKDAALRARAEGKMLGERLYDDDYIENKFKTALDAKQQKLFVLREALARNLLDISAAHEAYALTQGKNPNGIVNKAFNLAMQPMKLSEMASRKAAILATMELAQGQGKSFKRIMNNVSEVVNDTLFSYSKANKPAVLQGGTARVLAMFQWYRIMTVLRMGMLAKRSFAAETPEIKAAARKEFIGIMGMTTMLAGSLGLPLMKQVFAALDALADDDEPRDSELEFRKWAEENLGAAWGDVFTHGLPTLAGINISKRIGLGDLYGSQSQPPPRLHGKELAAWWAANQLGPAFGIVQGGFQGYDLMSKGEYLKGLEAALPKPLKDGLRAARVMQEGDVKSLTGRRTLAESEMTADVIPLLALGLNPAEIAQASKEGMSRSRISTAISERRGRVIDVMVQALEGDGDMEKARETLVTYNKKLPRFAIRGGDIRSALIRKMKEDRGIESRRDQLISSQYGL